MTAISVGCRQIREALQRIEVEADATSAAWSMYEEEKQQLLRDLEASRAANAASDAELRGPIEHALEVWGSARPTQELLADLIDGYRTLREHAFDMNGGAWAMIEALGLPDQEPYDTGELITALIKSRDEAITAADDFREQLVAAKSELAHERLRSAHLASHHTVHVNVDTTGVAEEVVKGLRERIQFAMKREQRR